MAREVLKLTDGKRYEFLTAKRKRDILEIRLSNHEDFEYIKENLSLLERIDVCTRGGKRVATFYDYTTIWKEDEHVLYLSKDGSVYTESEPVQKPKKVEPEERLLEDIRAAKISSLSEICNRLIVQGVDVVIDGEVEHFSFKTEDQMNLRDVFEYSHQTGMEVPYHADGKGFKLYTEEQITDIYLKAKSNLNHQMTYFNQLKMYVLGLDNMEDISKVYYGQELTGEYLERFQENFRQSELILSMLIFEDEESEEELPEEEFEYEEIEDLEEVLPEELENEELTGGEEDAGREEIGDGE